MLKETINILVTLDANYLTYLNVMLASLLAHNPDSSFDVYLLHSSICEEDVTETRKILGQRNRLILIDAGNVGVENAPTSSRYPYEIYYRIFAAKYLPENLDRILYLDPDIIVNGSIRELYELEMDNHFFAAASHIGKALRAVNGIRLNMEEDAPYINSGVMLMNLEVLRWEQNYEDVFEFIEKRKKLLMLPDQDIISSLYGSRILALDPYRYNMTERLYRMHSPFDRSMTLDWVRDNAVIIHYCGRNKPWKENYAGSLNVFYQEALKLLPGP